MNILLLEPDKQLANIYASTLRTQGYDVAVFHNGQSAIEACDVKVPEVVILELQLAHHGGIEFLYEFRSYPEWQSIPVIIHSGVPTHEFDMALLQAQLGIAHYLYKPQTTLATLLSTVEAVPALASI